MMKLTVRNLNIQSYLEVSMLRNIVVLHWSISRCVVNLLASGRRSHLQTKVAGALRTSRSFSSATFSI